ncbi:MAG: RNA polymerase sigma-70 factor [Bacteroidales bacterium]|nr:RNA polymerase sigma-70 factor [Bacteroidales bacterium]
MQTIIDISTFNKLFNEHYQKFVYFAMGYVKDETRSQDFVSDAFCTFWEKKEELPDDINAPGYILTIVRNNCLNYLKHKKVKHRATKELSNHAQWVMDTKINSLEACKPDKIFSEEINLIVNNTINNLPKRTAKIFRMSRFEQLSHREIGKEVGISTKAIEYHITKTLNELRINLKEFLTLLVLLSLYF